MTVEAAGKKQFREVRSGGSYLSQGDLRALFGLGEHAGPVDVEVRMPGGARWRWRGLPSGRLHVLELTDAARVRGRERRAMNAADARRVRRRCLGGAAARWPAARREDGAVYRPELATPEMVQQFLPYLEPGTDAFPAEREAKQLQARLRELGEALKGDPAKVASVADWLLAPGFSGGRLLGPDAASGDGPLVVTRAGASPRRTTRSRAALCGASCGGSPKGCARLPWRSS